MYGECNGSIEIHTVFCRKKCHDVSTYSQGTDYGKKQEMLFKWPQQDVTKFQQNISNHNPLAGLKVNKKMLNQLRILLIYSNLEVSKTLDSNLRMHNL